MTTPRRRIARSAGLVTAALGLALALVPPAMSAGTQSLSPSTVTVSDFAPVTLGGTAAATTATMSNFSVSDSAGAGWNVTVDATQFREFDATAGQYVVGGKVLPTGSLSMPAPTITPASPLVVLTAGPYALDGTSVKIASAVAGTSGTWDFTQNGSLSLALPASAYARVYRSDITVAVASGP